MLPKNLHYQNKVEAASARAYTTAIQPQNGTGPYGNGNTIIINIPTTNNTVLVPSESFLKFDLGGITNGANASTYIRLDKAGAHGVIQRLRILHGSQEIENLDNYGPWVGELMSLQQSSDSCLGKLNIMNGLSNTFLHNATTKETFPALVGERLTPQGGASLAGGNTPASRTYAINLMSMVGSLSPQYIPLYKMTAAPLSINIQLVSSALKIVNPAVALAAGTPFTVSNVEFIGSFIELSDDSVATIEQSLGGQPLQYVVQSYSNYSYNATLGTAATQVNPPIPFKYASLRSIFCIIRGNPDGAAGYFSQSSNHFYLSDWRVRIGSQLIPSKAPNSMVEHFAELIKAIGSLSDINHEPTLNMYTYNVPVPVASTETNALINETVKSDCFALGFDLESYSGADKEKLFAGMNTLNADMFWTLNHAAQGGATAVRYDFYALYDTVLVCENGQMYYRR